MEERDWLILKTLFVHQNITRTAEELYLSQPYLTKRLRQIEEAFGVELVMRGRRGVGFTPQGEYLAAQADRMLDRFAEIRKNVMQMKNEVAGTLKIGVSNHFSKNRLPPLLNRFRQLFPQIDYQVHAGWSKEIVGMVNNKQVHAGIVNGEFDRVHQAELLMNDPLVAVARREIRKEELPALTRIEYQTEHLSEKLAEQWWTENFSLPPKTGFHVDKADTAKELVKSGVGYAILPELVIGDRDQLCRYEIKDRNGSPVSSGIYLYYPEEFREIRLVGAFLDFMKKEHADFIE